MKPSQSLFILIQSLSQSEKRYFRIYASQFSSGPSSSLRLFDHLRKLDGYDEAAVQAHFEGDKIASHFAYEKNRLFQLILKAMRACHAGKSASAILQEHIKDLYFLGEKRHFEACRSVLRKAKKLATKHELYSDWLKLLRFERRFVKFLHHDRKRLDKRLSEITAEQRHIRSLFDQEYQYIELYDELLATIRQQLHRASEASQDRAKALLKSPLLHSQPSPGSFQATCYFHLCRAYCYQILQQKAKVFECYQENLDHWQSHTHRIKDEPFQYQRAVSNYLGTAFQLDRLDLFPAGLDAMDQLPQRTLNEKVEHFANYYYYYFLYHLNRRNFQETLASLPDILASLNTYAEIIAPSRTVAFYFNISVVYFVTGHYSAAVKSLSPIRNQHFGDIRKDLRRRACFIVLACHFELENLSLFDSLHRSTANLLFQGNGPQPGEQPLLRFFKKIYQLGPANKRDLVELAENTCRDLQGSDFEHSEMGYWLQNWS